MERIEVGMSPAQMSKVRNGHMIRCKPCVRGSGIVMIVEPSTFNIATKALGKNKGFQMRLSPNEIQANREGADEMMGNGIFKQVAKKAGKVAKKVAIEAGKQAGRQLAKQLPSLATSGLVAGATLLGQPQLIPVAGIVGDKLGKFAGKKLNKAIDGAGMCEGKARGRMSKRRIESIEGEGLYAGRGMMEGEGLYAGGRRGMGVHMDGEGLYAGGRRGMGMMDGGRITPSAGLVGVMGNLLPMSHPALQSQAMNANFQFRHTMPQNIQMRGNGMCG
jgi:hypothetical protein